MGQSGPHIVGFTHAKYSDCQSAYVYQTAVVFDLTTLDQVWALPPAKRSIKQATLHISDGEATGTTAPDAEVYGPGSCVAGIGIPKDPFEGHLGLMSSVPVAKGTRSLTWDVQQPVEAWLNHAADTPRERGLLLSGFNELLAAPLGNGLCTASISESTQIEVLVHVEK